MSSQHMLLPVAVESYSEDLVQISEAVQSALISAGAHARRRRAKT